MKFVIFAFALLACAFADVSELAEPGYDYAQPAPIDTYIPPAPQNEYIPPAPVDNYIPPVAEQSIIEEIEQPAQDGYRYKAVRRRVFRHRN